MLHTNFCGNRLIGFRDQDFRTVSTIYECGGHLGHVTQMPRVNLRFHYQWRLHEKFGFDRLSGFRGEDV